ncbi:PIN domain-containing protein [Candidatus Woesearchaeota archaeon]|nr:PIN domain-containing protein [Candidatus Woesearchaeota archaeon]
MNNETFFFDTYAFFEIIRGNPKYKDYISSNIITTIFNIAELNYNLKKERNKEIVNEITRKYHQFVVEITLEDIQVAMDLKINNKNFSIPDAIGYTVAKKYNVKFLTGDEGFKNMPSVEFVK